MRQIAADVYLLEGLRSSNVYALALPEGIALIDSGLPGTVDQIVAQLEKGGYALSDLRAVVLTHAHGDHTGNAAELAHRSGAQILAHYDEVPYIEGAKSLPAASLLQRVLIWIGNRVLGGQAFCRVEKVLEDGEVIEELGGLQVIHTPGHTPGSICLYKPEGRVLFCGDLLFNGHPLTGRGGLRVSISQFSVDVVQARESVRRLLEVPIEVLCLGHGEPILEGAGRRIREIRGLYDRRRQR
jgi:glyoxylase-like metal-dependent hydrolase (beta-lactamase superfamily II)